MAIIEGQPAPQFSLPDESGQKVSLSSYLGQYVVVYFYPKDDTPGCTKESCGFRDNHSELNSLNTTVLGISPDGAESHVKFINKFNLPFKLLSDTDKSVMTEYGAWGEKMMYGKKMIGTIRSTVIVSPDGTVYKHWKKVPKAADHPDKVLEVIKQATS